MRSRYRVDNVSRREYAWSNVGFELFGSAQILGSVDTELESYHAIITIGGSGFDTIETTLPISSPVVQSGSWFKPSHYLARSEVYSYVSSGSIRSTIEAHLHNLVEASTQRVELIDTVRYSRCNDYVTSGFRKRSRLGEVIMNPFFVEHCEIRCSPKRTGNPETVNFEQMGETNSINQSSFSFKYTGSCTSKWFGLNDDLINRLLDWAPPELMDPLNAVNAAYSNINDAAFDLPVFIGERKETLKLFTTTLRRVAGVIDCVKKGNFSKLAPSTYNKWQSKRSGRTPTSEIISDAWLEARYAWRPLIGDAVSLANLLSASSKFTPRQTFRAFRSDSSDDDFAFNGTTTFGTAGSVSYSIDESATTALAARAGFLCECSAGDSVLRDFGLLNPAGAVWDLVPYSFVIDRFVNIRSLISQLGSLGRIRSLGSWVTLSSVTDLAGTIEMTHASGPTEELRFLYSKTRKAREVDVGPKFSLNFDLNIDLTFIADAFALLWRLR